MSESFMAIFPADPLLPKPDLPRLRRQLLERGFMTEPWGSQISFDALSELWDEIMADRAQGRRTRPNRMNHLEALLGGLKDLDLVPKSLALDCENLALPAFVAALRERGCLSSEFSVKGEERFAPGPLYIQFCDVSEEEIARVLEASLYFKDFGDEIGVICGEGLFNPPAIPGADRVVEEWSELMDRWCKDPTQQWIDPETGKGYGVLDLDWDDTLGAGKCWLEIQSPGYIDGNRAAALLTELAGQRFRFSCCHL